MTGNEAIAYIHSMVWNRKATGYEHAKALLKMMGNPEKKLKYIHIGGTNGKGSTAAMLASILKKAGYKTGLYTSPYIFRFHERMQINGEQISDGDLAEVTEYVKSFADQMKDCPSEFALVCCIAFEYFARKKCDIVVLEVGMGGATDSTNVIECPEVAVLTNIGLDHTEYLGSTLEEIAATKAEILKANGKAVLYPSTREVENVVKQVCEERNIQLTIPDFTSVIVRQTSLEGQVFDYGTRKDMFLPLLGNHQLNNAMVVLSVVDALIDKGWDIYDTHVLDGFKEVTWPGRFEILGKKPLFIIDGGHNPQCIEALAQNVKDYLPGKKVIAIVGVLADKDYEEMFRPILKYIAKCICITPPCPRALLGKDLAEYLTTCGMDAVACDTVAGGVQKAVGLAGTDGAVICFGSLYSIADIRQGFEDLL